MLCQKVCNCSAQPSLCLKPCSLFSKRYEYCDYHEITTCLQIFEASAHIVTNHDQEFGIYIGAYDFFCMLKWSGVELVVASHVIRFVFRKTHSLNNKSLVSLFVVRATHSCLKYVHRKSICASSLCASSLFQQIVNFLVQIECFYMITWTLTHKKNVHPFFLD